MVEIWGAVVAGFARTRAVVCHVCVRWTAVTRALQPNLGQFKDKTGFLSLHQPPTNNGDATALFAMVRSLDFSVLLDAM